MPPATSEVAMDLVGDPHVAPHQPQQWVATDVRDVVDHPQHLDSGKEQEGAEQIQHPAELADQGSAEADHDGAQQDHSEDAPEQHAMLVDPRYREIAEDQRDHEHIVQGERFLDQEAGEVLHATGGAEIPPDPGAKRRCHADVTGRQPQALLDLDLMVFLVEYAQVENQKGDHNGEKEQPDPQILAEKIL